MKVKSGKNGGSICVTQIPGPTAVIYLGAGLGNAEAGLCPAPERPGPQRQRALFT